MSNFSPHSVVYNGVKYKTSEHAFQAAKAASKKEHDWVADAVSPLEAKRRGRKVKLKPYWDEVRDAVMLKVVLDKFWQNEDIAEKLVNTDEAFLIEGNNWHDDYWGMVKDADGNWRGRNQLGKTLMSVRIILRGRSNEK
jgi:hypothetical protein